MEYGMKMMNNSNNNIDYLIVWDTDCVMRGISLEEMKERNIIATNPDQICRIEYSAYNSFRFHFHESQVDSGIEFSFNTHNPSICTKPEEMGENLKDVVEMMESLYGDMSWDFAGVEAQSYGLDGKLTSFEFEYDLVIY